MNKVEIILMLLNSGRVRDVLEFVEGESPYLSDASEGAPQSPELRKIWIMMVHHLRYLANFGDGSSIQIHEGKIYRPYPEEFDAWIKAGAPGIAEQDMKKYFDENPL
jgi:hypothetical protein